jgi:hypothetical protein
LKAAYRSYEDFFQSGNGFYVEARSRLAFLNVLGNGSVMIFSSWALYSDLAGSVIPTALTELAPGVYVEGGNKVEIYKGISDWLVAGASLMYSGRIYHNDVTPAGDKRVDKLLVSGVSLLFPHVLSYQTDLRLDYKYL